MALQAVDYDPFKATPAPPPAAPAAAAPKLVPVDHDPFAAQGSPAAAPKPVAAAPQPNLTPVDHDPFAAVKKAWSTPYKPKPGDNFLQRQVGMVEHGAGLLGTTLDVPAELYGAGVSKLTGGRYPQEQGRKDFDTALMAAPSEGSLGEVRTAAKEAKAAAEAIKGKFIPVDHDPFAPTPKAGSTVAAEADPATRTANALYRLKGGSIADKAEMLEKRKGLAKETLDPARNEEAYHAVEHKLVDPKAEIPEHLKDIADAHAPLHAEETQLVNDIKKLANPAADELLEDQGYVHRIKKGAPGDIDTTLDGASRDPFRGTKSVSKTTGSLKGRKFVVLEDPETGKRTFVKDPDPEWKPGMQVRGSFDKPMNIKQATTKEIEAAGVKDADGKPLTYQKNLLENTMDNVVRLRRVKRNIETLNATLEDMKARGVAQREEWQYRDADGKLQTASASANERAPQGWASMHDNPWLKGWKFDINDPQVQELKDFLPKPTENAWDTLDRVNNFALRSNFLSPFIHPKNVAEFWATGRGGDWLSLGGYSRLAQTMPRAIQEVLTMGPEYQRMLREGSALLSGDSRAEAGTQKFHQALVDKGAEELTSDPKSFAELKKWGVWKTPAEAYTAIQKASHNMMWGVSDVMMMQRVLELEKKGMAPRAAIAKAEEMIPNYRVPAQVAGSRMMSNVLKGNRMFALGPYHYNKLAAWGRMFKKVAKGTPEEQKEAAGQFAAMAILGAGVLPAIDKGIQMATKNSNAKVKRGGMLSVPDTAASVSKGEEGLPQAIASVIDLSPAAATAVEGIKQKDWRGQDIASQFDTPAHNVLREGEWAASKFGPANLAAEAASPTYGPARTAASQLGVDLPDRPKGQMKGSTRKMLTRQQSKRDARDPLMQALGQ